MELELQNFLSHQATGATLFGSDCGRWPAWWHDVITLIQTQRKLIERGDYEADRT